MVQVKKQLNRDAAALMSALMILSYFTILTSTQTNAASDSVSISFENTGMTWKSYFMTSYGAMSAGVDIGYVTADGKPAYCIQPGATLYNGNVLYSNSDTWTKKFSGQERNAISLAMYYGYPNTNISLVGDKYDKYAATQLIIWELIDNCRDVSTYSRTDAKYYSSLNKTNNVVTNYRVIVAAMQKHTRIPSFSGQYLSSAKSVELKWNSSSNSYNTTLTDSNGVLSSNGYTFTSTNSNVRFTKSGNTLTITSSVPITSALTIRGETKVINEGKSAVVWSAPECQDIITGEGKVDPVYCYIKLTTESVGKLELVKISEDGVIENVRFHVYGTSLNGTKIDETVTTDKDGKASIKNLLVGTYTVEEIGVADYYVPQPAQTVKVEANKTATVTFINVLKTGKLRVIKISEDKFIEGIIFRLYGTAINGAEIDMTAKTNADGIALFDNIPISNNLILTELNTDERYIVPETQYADIEWNKVTEKTVENILIKGSVTTIKIDADYPENKLSGAEFTVYADNDEKTIIGILKESEAGIYTLENIVYGDYILKETKAPVGFKLDENEYMFSITTDGQTVTVDTLAGVGFINDAQKGSLVINKTSSDGKLEGFSFLVDGITVTGQTYSQIFVTDKDGKIVIEGLRVGTYTVSEISDESNARYELPADQTVIIKNDKTTELPFFNKEKEIPFTITKTDISTGELIPNCGFRIKDSDGNVVVEGYTDENGVAEFQLVCGSYTYQEFDAPEGYLIDETEYSFIINPDNTIVKAEMRNIGTGTIEITKKDVSTGELLPDCGIEILDENMNVIFKGKTDADGVVRFTLKYGKYYYREYEAPTGYVIDETPFEFEIKENGEIVRAVMTDMKIPEESAPSKTPEEITPSKTPEEVQTGDNGNFAVFLFVSILSALIIGVLLCRKNREKNK